MSESKRSGFPRAPREQGVDTDLDDVLDGIFNKTDSDGNLVEISVPGPIGKLAEEYVEKSPNTEAVPEQVPSAGKDTVPNEIKLVDDGAEAVSEDDDGRVAVIHDNMPFEDVAIVGQKSPTDPITSRTEYSYVKKSGSLVDKLKNNPQGEK